MDRISIEYNKALANTVITNLKKNGFEAMYFENVHGAREYILDTIKEGQTVGVGGSATILKMDVKDALKSKGAILYDHSLPELTQEDKLKVLKSQLTSNVFICSTNAVTYNGELINVDGIGNRVSALNFGPDKSIILLGINKIVEDEEAAYKRVKRIAAPKNSVRFNNGNPCTKLGYCVDCNSEKRICRIYSTIKKKPMLTDITVIIIGEKLGF